MSFGSHFRPAAIPVGNRSGLFLFVAVLLIFDWLNGRFRGIELRFVLSLIVMLTEAVLSAHGFI